MNGDQRTDISENRRPKTETMTGEDRARARRIERKRQRRMDRKLAPLSAAAEAHIPYRLLAHHMRNAEVTVALTESDACHWHQNPDVAPQWFRDAATDYAVQQSQRDASRRHANDLRLLAMEQDRLDGERLMAETLSKLRSGDKFFSWDQKEILYELRYDASRLLVCSGADDLDDDQRAVLGLYRVDPNNHTTWYFHDRRCDGGPARDCDDRIEQMRLDRRVDSLLDSVRREGDVVSMRLVPGQPVSTWNGTRVAMVVKNNRVSVKIRYVGGKQKGYAPVERNVDPQYLDTDVSGLPKPPEPGSNILLCGHNKRLRSAVVTAIDGPLFEAEYQLKSGQTRRSWFDVLDLRESGVPGQYDRS